VTPTDNLSMLTSPDQPGFSVGDATVELVEGSVRSSFAWVEAREAERHGCSTARGTNSFDKMYMCKSIQMGSEKLRSGIS